MDSFPFSVYTRHLNKSSKLFESNLPSNEYSQKKNRLAVNCPRRIHKHTQRCTTKYNGCLHFHSKRASVRIVLLLSDRCALETLSGLVLHGKFTTRQFFIRYAREWGWNAILNPYVGEIRPLSIGSTDIIYSK